MDIPTSVRGLKIIQVLSLRSLNYSTSDVSAFLTLRIAREKILDR